MKHLITFAVLLFVVASSHKAAAQTVNSWVEISPTDEFFRVSMPHQPISEEQRTSYGGLNARGKQYEVSADGASYAVWALVNSNYQSNKDPDEYLDACAELLWEALLKPARDKLPKVGRAAMSYEKELPAKPLAGREYSLTIGEQTGTARFYIAGPRIYLLLATNSPGGVWAREIFFESFSTSPSLPIPRALYGEPVVKSKDPANSSDDEVFGPKDTTQKVRVLEKPEPIYTESARKYRVQGTVVLRAVFSKDGEVKDIT